MEYVTNAGGAQTNATTTMADATSLGFAVEANARYMVTALISYDAPTATDIKFEWTGPAGVTMNRNVLGLAIGTADNMSSSFMAIRRGTGTDQTAGGPNGTTSAFSVYVEHVDILTSSTAGTAQFRFAANAAGTATLQGDCMIYYQRIA
jgi:hypothetical protein